MGDTEIGGNPLSGFEGVCMPGCQSNNQVGIEGELARLRAENEKLKRALAQIAEQLETMLAEEMRHVEFELVKSLLKELQTDKTSLSLWQS